MQHLICNSDGNVVFANQDIVSVEATDYGLFDELGTIVYNKISAAYALCRLFTSYTGPQVRIRRSSDNALVDLYFNHDGYIIDFDFTQWIGTSTGYVVTWYDQGPSGKHTYGYGSTLPFIYRLYENKYVIYFNGTSTTAGGYFDSGSFTLNIATNGGFSSFSCVNFLSPNNWERVYDFGNTSANYNTIFARMDTSLRTRFSTFQGSTEYSLDTNDGVSDNTWSTYGNRIQGSGSSWVYSTRINRVDRPTTTTAVTFTDRTVSRSWIGRSNWSGDSYANMYMACQVFFNTGSITTNDFYKMEVPFSNFGTNPGDPVVGGNGETIGSSSGESLSGVPSSFSFGTYSTTNIIPPVLTAITQSGYTVSGHSGTSTLLDAFNRSAGNNYTGSPYPFSNNIYTGPSKTWSGVATYKAPWIMVQLPSSQSIKGIVVRPEAVTNLGQKPRLLGSNDGTNWTLLWYTNTFLNSPTGTRNNMNPVVIILGSATAAYKYYTYVWLENLTKTGDYLPRVAQLNFIV